MSQCVVVVIYPTREDTIMPRFVGLFAAVILMLNDTNAAAHQLEKRQEPNNGSAVCYGDLGCFSNDGAFQSEYRPIPFLPESPNKIDPKFMLYTRQSPTVYTRLRAGDVEGLKASTFQADRPTKFIVHGFLDNTLVGDWMEAMTREFLIHRDCNVIIVDWGFGSLALYGQASANTRVVGAMTAQLITFMQNVTGARPEDMHIVGHSLGAHAAGYAGERLHHLGRISGLDPAEVYFQYTDVAVRLDPTDALFVDVIHTDDGGSFTSDMGIGMKQPCGHVDFYPNGGNDQPGCEKGPVSQIVDLGLVNGVREFVFCDHLRAYHLFQESINSHCPFESYRCASYDDFNQGKCIPCSGEDCGFMGMHADKVKPTSPPTTNLYYLKTGSQYPFCRYHLKVQLTFAAPSVAQQEWGLLYVTVIGSEGRTDEVKLTEDSIDIQPGNTYTYVVTSREGLGGIQSVTLRWDQQFDLFDTGSWISEGTLYIDKVEVYSAEAQTSTSLCGNGVAVEKGQSVTISETC